MPLNANSVMFWPPGYSLPVHLSARVRHTPSLLDMKWPGVGVVLRLRRTLVVDEVAQSQATSYITQVQSIELPGHTVCTCVRARVHCVRVHVCEHHITRMCNSAEPEEKRCSQAASNNMQVQPCKQSKTRGGATGRTGLQHEAQRKRRTWCNLLQFAPQGSGPGCDYHFLKPIV